MAVNADFLDRLDPSLLNAVADQAPMLLPDVEQLPPVQLPPGSELLAPPDALVAPPGAPAPNADGSWTPETPVPVPAPQPVAGPAPAPKAPAVQAPGGLDKAVEEASKAEAKAIQAKFDADQANAARVAEEEANRALDARLERQAKEDEVNTLRQQYDELAQSSIDSSGAYKARFGEGPMGAISVMFQALAAGFYGQGTAWKADVEKSVDKWVAEEQRKKSAELASIDQRMGVAGAGLKMLEERAYDAVQRAWDAKAASSTLDGNKAAVAAEISAGLSNRRAANMQARDARLAAAAERNWQRKYQERQLALQEGKLAQDALLNAQKMGSEAEQRVLAGKLGTSNVGDSAANWRSNEAFLKTAKAFDWSSKPAQWGSAQVDALKSFVGSNVDVSDERALKAGLVEMRKKQFAATGGVLSPKEAEALEAKALPQLMAEIEAGHKQHGSTLNEALRVYDAPEHIRQRLTGGMDYTVSKSRPR